MSMHRKLVGTVAVAIVAGALGASAAVAGPADLRSPGVRDAAQPATVATPGADLRSPDAQDLGRGIASGSVAGIDFRSPDVVDLGNGGVRVAPPAPVDVVQVGPSSGFDWGDAAIGAGGLAALALLGIGIALMEMHRRRSHLKPPSALAH